MGDLLYAEKIHITIILSSPPLKILMNHKNGCFRNYIPSKKAIGFKRRLLLLNESNHNWRAITLVSFRNRNETSTQMLEIHKFILDARPKSFLFFFWKNENCQLVSSMESFDFWLIQQHIAAATLLITTISIFIPKSTFCLKR